MKKFAWVIICLIPLVSTGQKEHPDLFKSSRINHYKNNITIYYNPLLDHYDLHFVKLDIEVTDQSTYIAGNALLQGKATQDLDTFILELSNYLTVDSVIIDNAKVNFQHQDNLIRYIFESPLNTNDDFTVRIYYHGTPSPYGGGVTNAYSSQWGKQMTWTLSESFHAYEWWPCKQVLSDKIDSVYVFLTCDNDCKAGSNGLLTAEVNLPNNKKRFEWKTYYPINYYLISFAVAEYQDYSIYAHPTGSNPILIQNYIYNATGCLDYYQTQIDETPSMIELFSDKFGLYPFANEKYGHCLTTLGGGMEHQTMTTLGNFGYTLV
jgi:aminopeptidase N